MKKTDFISNYTDDLNEATAEAVAQANRCDYIVCDDLVSGWFITPPYKVGQDIRTMTADELATVHRSVEDMMEDLKKFADAVSAMATAKEKFENIDLYEFEEEE